MWHPKCFVPVYENFTRIKIPYWSVYTCILEFIIYFLLVKGSILYPNTSGACWLLLERWAILIDIFKKGINLIAKKKQCQSIWKHSDRFYNIEEPNSEPLVSPPPKRLAKLFAWAFLGLIVFTHTSCLLFKHSKQKGIWASPRKNESSCLA